MAKRRTYKRDRRGRFASTGTSRARRIGRKIRRHRPRYIRGSVGQTVRVGRVGPGGEYAGAMENDIHAAHNKYLKEFGGHRAKNDASTHHAISVSRVAEWKDRWEVLGILPTVE